MKNAVSAFDACAGDYDKWFDSPEGSVIFSMESEAVRLLMKGLERPFLEIGIGTGRFAKELGIEYGIDPSLKALVLAEKRGVKVNAVKGEELPFSENFFGAVFILFTLCFVDDDARVISEAKRVLKAGGCLIIGIINRESGWGQLYSEKKDRGHPIYKYARLYNAKEVSKLLEAAGMAVEGYSSTLCQPPSDMPYKEPVHSGLSEGAGFVCIRARKLL